MTRLGEISPFGLLYTRIGKNFAQFFGIFANVASFGATFGNIWAKVWLNCLAVAHVLLCRKCFSDVKNVAGYHPEPVMPSAADGASLKTILSLQPKPKT